MDVRSNEPELRALMMAGLMAMPLGTRFEELLVLQMLTAANIRSSEGVRLLVISTTTV